MRRILERSESKLMTNVEEREEKEGEVTELTPRKLFPGHLKPAVSRDM